MPSPADLVRQAELELDLARLKKARVDLLVGDRVTGMNTTNGGSEGLTFQGGSIEALDKAIRETSEELASLSGDPSRERQVMYLF